MAPKKKEVQKLSLGDFLQDPSFGGGGGSWADEVEDTYGTQPLPPSERRTGQTSYGGSSSYGGNDRGYHSLRDNLPQKLPDKPPFTAHLGNLSYDATVESVTEFFEGCDIVSVRIIEDREQNRPKGFAYAEFADVEGLKTALTRDGMTFQGRSIRIKVADPPRGGFERTDSARELDWSQRRGPLADVPSRGGDRRGPDFGERRGPREFQPSDDGKVRDFSNWERRGPLSPLSPPERPESREGSRPRTNEGRSESFRGTRRASPAAWGPGEGRQDGSRPPRREFADRPERPERVPTAAEKETNWRSLMRPDAPAKSPGQSHEGTEAPPSPAASAAAQPSGRPKLQLTKRTVSEAADTTPAAATTTDSKASPFGAARPIDTAAREREVEERRLREKKEAEERAKEEKRAREAAAKEAAEKAAAEEAAKANNVADTPVEEAKPAAAEAAADGPSSEQKIPIRPREARDSAPAPKSRAVESGNWRQASGEQRAPSRGGHIPSGPRRGGPARGPRSDIPRAPRSSGNGPAPQPPQSPSVEQSPSTPTVDEDGWTMVPNKGRRGQSNRPVVS
ncbi:hypothetical protein N656DRAFT_766523 [Canariomyces notabilis]|uniref:RRM domain-containing protein n=1 Tax=Canariomyces notabilis TaxID=2074819 RepID=A0AAN6TIV7_9PEZI|nr:hypothetical protein N656DRAFT_766523 [Canariomyces arenarius]